MLQLKIPDSDLFDEKTQTFIKVRGQTIQLEHSLVSMSKWESKWCKPFLSNKEMTIEETIDYIRCMTITQNVDPNIYSPSVLNHNHIKEVTDYINKPHTATTIKTREGQGSSRQVITTEVIYYYMVAYQIPFDPCQKWHFNRLMTLIRVCDEKNNPKKKMGRRQTAMQNHNLNAARRARMNTRG